MPKSALLLLLLSTCFAALAYEPENKPDNAWSIFTTPSKGRPQAIGGYANGCMAGAVALPEVGTGYIDMRRHRNRYWGQPELIEFIKALGEQTNRQHGRKHLIGDLSQARGGKMNYGHSSHQIGLDVDVWLQTVTPNESVNPYRDMQTIVNKASGKVLNEALTPATRDALYFSATYPSVTRIFVNPIIKWHLCQTEQDVAWLNKIRPWWGHDEHFHVRLACPFGMESCQSQKPPPAGSGCNDSLLNWVNEQSDIVTGKIKPKPARKKKPKAKILPASCLQLRQ